MRRLRQTRINLPQFVVRQSIQFALHSFHTFAHRRVPHVVRPQRFQYPPRLTAHAFLIVADAFLYFLLKLLRLAQFVVDLILEFCDLF